VVESAGALKFIYALIRIMVNTTRKVSADTLQKLVKKYSVTKSGSKNEVALRLWKLRMHVMSVKDLKIVEDFLKLEPAKRYQGPRQYIKLY